MASPEWTAEVEQRIKDSRSQHVCLSVFEEFTACMTPSRQLRMYYAEGTHENCPVYLFRFTDCLERKIPGAAERVQRREHARLDGLAGKHVWPFKREYASEAYERYGVRPQRRQAGPDAGPLATVAAGLDAPGAAAPAAGH